MFKPNFQINDYWVFLLIFYHLYFSVAIFFTLDHRLHGLLNNQSKEDG